MVLVYFWKNQLKKSVGEQISPVIIVSQGSIPYKACCGFAVELLLIIPSLFPMDYIIPCYF